ncbi:MAG: hypothetical protein V8T36_11015 [Ruthenibacterium lactatiformans]
MIGLDKAAPIFLLLGSKYIFPDVSLINNFEIVATSVIARAIFKETSARRLRRRHYLVDAIQSNSWF